MKGKRLLTLIGSICLILVLAALLLPACTKEVAPPTGAEEAQLQAKITELEGEVARLEKKLAEAGAAVPVEKPVTLRFAHYFSPVDFRHECCQHWADLVEERSDGVITVEIYPAESLVKGTEGLASTGAGVCDLYSVYGGYVTGAIPLTDYFCFLFPTYSDEEMISIVHKSMHLLSPLFEEQNIKLLGMLSSSGTSPGFFTKPVHTLEDLQGLKMRGAGGMVGKGLEALGHAVTYMSAAEQYTALQTKTVDGTCTTLMSYTSWKLWEVAPYCLTPTYTRTPYWQMMNLDTWNSLSPTQQDILLEATADTEQWMVSSFKGVEDELWTKIRPNLKEDYIQPKEERERWEAQVAPLKDGWMAEVGADAQEIDKIAKEVMGQK